MGCDPRLVRADLLSTVETVELLQRESRLIEVATPFLNALSRAAGDDRHAAMLSDGQGRVLKIAGDPLTIEDENFPRAGSLLSEATAGANGIGTTLAEGRYVELVGPEHFIEGFHVFTCQGVPLFETANAPSGALSMSLRRVEAANKVRDILFCASEAAACELLSRRLSEAIVTTGGLQTFLEPLRQDLVQGIAIARLQLELAAHDIASGNDAALSLGDAYQLSQTFRRHAAVWRDLSDQATGSAEPIVLTDLADEFTSLMATEARVTNVTMHHGRMEKVLVLDDRRALSQRLLGAFLTAMQSAQVASEIRIDVFADALSGAITLTGISANHELVTYKTHSKLLK